MKCSLPDIEFKTMVIALAVWLGWLEHCTEPKRLWVQFPARTHT